MTVLERKAKLASAILNDTDEEHFVEMEMFYKNLKTGVHNNGHYPTSCFFFAGKKPTLEELDKSIESLSDSDITRIMQNAGIIDEDGNITEIYKP